MRSKPLVTHYRQQIKKRFHPPLSVPPLHYLQRHIMVSYLLCQAGFKTTRTSIVHREWSASDTPLPPDRVFCGRMHRGRKRLAALRFVYHCPWRTANQTKNHGVAVTFWERGSRPKGGGTPQGCPSLFVRNSRLKKG